MQTKLLRKNKVIAVLFAAFFGGIVSVQPNHTQTSDFTAGSLLERMTSSELNAYLTGVVHGLAYTRYKQEGNQTDGGMDCILGWFFNGGQAVKQIMQAFRKFENHAPYAVVAAMVEQKCGE